MGAFFKNLPGWATPVAVVVAIIVFIAMVSDPYHFYGVFYNIFFIVRWLGYFALSIALLVGTIWACCHLLFKPMIWARQSLNSLKAQWKATKNGGTP